MNTPGPAIVGGIGALLLFAACMHSGSSDDAKNTASASSLPSAPATVTVTVPAPAPGASYGIPPTSGGYTGPTNGAAGISPAEAASTGGTNRATWTGPFLIGSYGINFDLEPPGPGHGGGAGETIDFVGADHGGEGRFRWFSAGGAAAWPLDTDPTYQQCVNQLNTQPISAMDGFSVPYQSGQAWCFLTHDGTHVAFVRTLERDGSGIQATGTQWRKVQQQ